MNSTTNGNISAMMSALGSSDPAVRDWQDQFDQLLENAMPSGHVQRIRCETRSGPISMSRDADFIRFHVGASSNMSALTADFSGVREIPNCNDVSITRDPGERGRRLWPPDCVFVPTLRTETTSKLFMNATGSDEARLHLGDVVLMQNVLQNVAFSKLRKLKLERFLVEEALVLKDLPELRELHVLKPVRVNEKNRAMFTIDFRNMFNVNVFHFDNAVRARYANVGPGACVHAMPLSQFHFEVPPGFCVLDLSICVDSEDMQTLAASALTQIAASRWLRMSCSPRLRAGAGYGAAPERYVQLCASAVKCGAHDPTRGINGYQALEPENAKRVAQVVVQNACADPVEPAVLVMNHWFAAHIGLLRLPYFDDKSKTPAGDPPLPDPFSGLVRARSYARVKRTDGTCAAALECPVVVCMNADMVDAGSVGVAWNNTETAAFGFRDGMQMISARQTCKHTVPAMHLLQRGLTYGMLAPDEFMPAPGGGGVAVAYMPNTFCIPRHKNAQRVDASGGPEELLRLINIYRRNKPMPRGLTGRVLDVFWRAVGCSVGFPGPVALSSIEGSVLPIISDDRTYVVSESESDGDSEDPLS